MEGVVFLAFIGWMASVDQKPRVEAPERITSPLEMEEPETELIVLRPGMLVDPETRTTIQVKEAPSFDPVYIPSEDEREEITW